VPYLKALQLVSPHKALLAGLVFLPHARLARVAVLVVALRDALRDHRLALQPHERRAFRVLTLLVATALAVAAEDVAGARGAAAAAVIWFAFAAFC
jgi:hypothetical protein